MATESNLVTETPIIGARNCDVASCKVSSNLCAYIHRSASQLLASWTPSLHCLPVPANLLRININPSAQLARANGMVKFARVPCMASRPRYLQDAHTDGTSVGSIHLALKPTLGILAGIRGNKARSSSAAMEAEFSVLLHRPTVLLQTKLCGGRMLLRDSPVDREQVVAQCSTSMSLHAACLL